MKLNLFKKKANLLLLMMLLVLSVILAACGGSSDSQSESDSSDSSANGSAESDEKYTIRFSIVGTENHPMSQALFELEDELVERSGGRLEIDFYPNGQLYPDERETNEAIQLGNIEMSVSTTASLSSFHEDLMIYDLPHLFSSREQAHAVVDGEFGQELLKGLEEVGLKALGYQENGFRHLINNKRPITDPEDLKGLKMRVLPSKGYQDAMNTLGADASPLAFGELYSALQQGTFDGFESTVDLLNDNKFYEVQKYLTLSYTFYSPNIAIVNKEFFDNLPEDLQEVLTEWTNEFNNRAREIMAELEQGHIDKLKQEMEVTELTPEQVAKFEEAVQPVYDQFAKELGADLVEAAKKAAEEAKQ